MNWLRRPRLKSAVISVGVATFLSFSRVSGFKSDISSFPFEVHVRIADAVLGCSISYMPGAPWLLT